MQRFLFSFGFIKYKLNLLSLTDDNNILFFALSSLISPHLMLGQIPLPEEPDTEDESEIKKWRWKVKAVKKENSERHSQRCDIELKLTVRKLLCLV